MQLRTLMMDELPAIIHRLSLRLWCPEYRAKETEESAQAAVSEKEEIPIDPFASPPQDAVDARGNVLNASEISSLSLDGGSEIQSLFSQKNLLRLATLNDSHRTLSLFTPSIRDAVFRAWAGPSERGDSAGTSTPVTPSLIRSHSSVGSTSTTYTFTSKTVSEDGLSHLPSRPSLVSMHSATTGLSLGAGRHSRSHGLRKKKNRVVNLRRSKTTDDLTSDSGSDYSSTAATSEPPLMSPLPVIEEPEDNIITPPRSPNNKVRFRTSSIDLGETPRKLRLSTPSRPPLTSNTFPLENLQDIIPTTEKADSISQISTEPAFKRPELHLREASYFSLEKAAPVLSQPTNPTSILEQAWVMKMAGEIARRSQDEKAAREGFWTQLSREDSPPPAYQPQA